MLVIGNPTNMYLALNSGVTFLQYFKVMFLPAVVAGLCGLGVLLIIFNKKLREPFNVVEEKYNVEDVPLMIFALIMMGVTIVLLSIANFIMFELYLIVLVMGLILSVVAFAYLYLKKKPVTPVFNAYKKAPWSFIPLILGMFVLVEALGQNGIILQLVSLLDFGEPIYTYGISSFITSNVMNNQPMSMLFNEMLLTFDMTEKLPAMYASVNGSNLGVLFTPLGALAGLMWMNILKQNDVKLSFFSYIKYIGIVGIVTLTLSLVTLFLIYV